MRRLVLLAALLLTACGGELSTSAHSSGYSSDSSSIAPVDRTQEAMEMAIEFTHATYDLYLKGIGDVDHYIAEYFDENDENYDYDLAILMLAITKRTFIFIDVQWELSNFRTGPLQPLLDEAEVERDDYMAKIGEVENLTTIFFDMDLYEKLNPAANYFTPSEFRYQSWGYLVYGTRELDSNFILFDFFFPEVYEYCHHLDRFIYDFS